MPRPGPIGWLMPGLIAEARFAADSALEGDGFEPSVPHKKTTLFGCPRSVPQFAFRNKNRLFRAGTDGSNLPSSRDESANLRSPSGGRWGRISSASRRCRSGTRRAANAARAAERLVDGLPGRRIILDRPAHALDRLLRAVAGFRFQIFVDLPQRRLRMVADPRRGATLAHHVPARLVLAVVMAAADREVVFGPNDLRAGLEAVRG